MDIKSEITGPSIVLYIGCIFWTLYYDTLYAFSDIKDDKKIGVKSLARFLEERNYRLWLGSFGLVADVIISYAFLMTGHNMMVVIIGFACALAVILWQIITLDIYDSKGCLSKFTLNSYVGIIWAVTALVNSPIFL